MIIEIDDQSVLSLKMNLLYFVNLLALFITIFHENLQTINKKCINNSGAARCKSNIIMKIVKDVKGEDQLRIFLSRVKCKVKRVWNAGTTLSPKTWL